jgi:hypothetical protein
MYLMNVSLFHLPISCIVVTGTRAKYIAIALPDFIEWHPISSILKPSDSSPSDAAAALIFERICVDVMCPVRPCCEV